MPSHANPAVGKFNHEYWTENEIVDGTAETNLLYDKLDKKGNVKSGIGGTEIKGPAVRTTRMVVDPWNGVNTTAPEEPDMHIIPEFGWIGYKMHWLVKVWDEWANRGQAKINDMMEEYSSAARTDWHARLGAGIYVDGSALSVQELWGLPSFVKNTGSYAGHSQTTTWWGAQQITGTALPGVTYANNPGTYLTHLEILCTHGPSQNGSNRPDLVMMSGNAWRHFHNYLEANFRHVIESSDSFKGGHRVQIWNGLEIGWDVNLTSASDVLYMLNTDKLTWYFQHQKKVTSKEHDSIDPPGKLFQLLGKMQLGCKGPRHQAKLITLGI